MYCKETVDAPRGMHVPHIQIPETITSLPFVFHLLDVFRMNQ